MTPAHGPRRTTPRALLGAIVLTTALVGLVACAGAGSGSSSDSAGPTAVGDLGTVGSAAGGGTTDSPAGAGRAQAAGSPAEAAGSSPAVGQAPAVISTGDVALRADDVGAARFSVQQVVDHYAGKISDERSEADRHGQLERTRLVVRVPARDFQAVLGRLQRVADLVSTTSSAEDVTTQVIDTGVRVRSQRAAIDRIRLLLARASSIRDIITIEGELNQRQGDLDSLERRQAYLADQTAQGTITVSITRTPRSQTPPAPAHHRGFLTGLHAGWSWLRTATVAVLTAGGAALPFAGVVLVLGVPLWLLRRRRARPVPAPDPAV